MSNSGVFLIKESKEVVEFKLLATPRLIFEDESHSDVPAAELHKREEEDKKKKDDDERCCEVKTPDEECERPSLGEVKVIEEEDDGFKTPTSLDHKIPVIKQCPPAPKKPKPQMKRRIAAYKVRRNLRLEVSEEVESLFPFPLLSDSKRRRREI
jgi:hypothetical protein